MRRRTFALVMLAIACGPTDSTANATAASVTSSAASESATNHATTDATMRGDLDGTQAEPTGMIGEPTGSDFLGPRSDVTGHSFECSPLSQDCPVGFKCTYWSNNGRPSWNAARCVPVVRDPAQSGEPCVMLDSGTSGLDDCDIGTMCWNVDEHGDGVCIDLCIGDWNSLHCPDPSEHCFVGGSGLALCLPTCNPLLDDCAAANEVCYPRYDAWACAQDASGRSGASGDPCEFTNACDAGLVCIAALHSSICASPIGCCSLVCDIADPGADAACAQHDPAQSCEPWYTLGQAPPGFANVGVCMIKR